MTDAIAPSTAPPQLPEEWTYIGKRLNHGKVAYAWLDTAGEERWYTRLKAYAVGGKYRVLVQHKGDQILASSSVSFLSSAASDDPRALEWAVISDVVETQIRRKARERKVAQTDPIKETLNPIRDLLKKSNRYERRAILATVIDYLTFSWEG